MTRSLFAGFAALLLADTVQATSIALIPLPQRVAGAEGVFVGKVVSITETPMKSEAFKGDDRLMHIATVKVSETLLGKAAREIKVAFYVPSVPKPGAPMIAGGGFFPRLNKDEEGLLILAKHTTLKDAFQLSGYPPLVRKDAKDYLTRLKVAKDSARRLAEPMKGLKSESAEERAATAAILIHRYKTPPGKDAKTEAVPAAESKLILEGLAGVDWAGRGWDENRITPEMAFFRLNLTEADGWKDAKGAFDPEAAKKWLKDNAGKYKMTRFVREVVVSEEPSAPSK